MFRSRFSAEKRYRANALTQEEILALQAMPESIDKIVSHLKPVRAELDSELVLGPLRSSTATWPSAGR